MCLWYVEYLPVFSIPYTPELILGFLFIAGGYHLDLKYKDFKTDVALLTLVCGFSPDDAVARMKSVLLKRHTSTTDDDSVSVGVENQLSMCTLDDNDDDIQQHIIQDIDNGDSFSTVHYIIIKVQVNKKH